MKKSVSRTLAMALATCMAAGTLAACGSSGSSAVASSAAESTADSTAASTESGTPDYSNEDPINIRIYCFPQLHFCAGGRSPGRRHQRGRRFSAGCLPHHFGPPARQPPAHPPPCRPPQHRRNHWRGDCKFEVRSYDALRPDTK